MTAASSPTSRPVPKVVAATLGSAVAAIVLWAIEVATEVEVPTLVAGAVVSLCTFAAGYIKHPAGALYDDADSLEHLGDGRVLERLKDRKPDAGRALLGTLGVVLLVISAVLTVTTLLGLTVIGWFALVATALIGLTLLLLDGSTVA